MIMINNEIMDEYLINLTEYSKKCKVNRNDIDQAQLREHLIKIKELTLELQDIINPILDANPQILDETPDGGFYYSHEDFPEDLLKEADLLISLYLVEDYLKRFIIDDNPED